jgi:hypothetical protein
MKAHPAWLVLFPAWVACGDSPSQLPDAPADVPFTIRVISAQAPVLVAFRDGLDAAWQAATPGTSVDVVVHRSYTVAVVCEEPDAWRTWQFAGYPGFGGGTVTTPCAPAPVRHKVTGHAARAGAVYFGGTSAQSTVDDWSFELAVPAGTYDLIATSKLGVSPADDRIVVRRAIAVADDVALASTIDVDSEGSAMAHVALTSATPPPADGGESLSAVVALQPSGSPASAQIYEGPAAGAPLAPQAVLTAGDVQTATLEAVKVDATTGNVAARGLRRSFRIGDATAFALPSGIGDPVWRADPAQLSVALPERPDVDLLQVFATGTAADGKAAIYQLDLSSTYLLSTNVAHPTLDTVVPDYQAAWRIDVSKAYSLTIAASRKVDAGVEIASSSRQVDPASRP